MKSATQITLSRSWWKKEAPDGLKKSAPGLERALDDLAKAESDLAKAATEAGVKAMEKAIAGVEQAAQAVVTEAKGLLKSTKDKAAVADLENTVAVMGKPLSRALEDLRKAMPAVQSEDEDDGPFGSLKDHGAYIQKWVPKLKAQVVPFAFALTGDGAGDARFHFHMTKEGRGLANALKSKIDTKRLTWGMAGTTALTAALNIEDEAGKTLALNVEGKVVKGLAKRAKKLLRELGLSAFNKVVVLAAGVLVESADDETADLPDDAPAPVSGVMPAAGPQADAAGPQAAGAPPADDWKSAIKKRYEAVMKALKPKVKGDDQRRMLELARLFSEALANDDRAFAEDVLLRLGSAANGNLAALDSSRVPNDAEHRDALADEYALTRDQVARLEDWIARNHLQESYGPNVSPTGGLRFKDEKGGELLADAVKGKGALGDLTPGERDFLVMRCLRKWIYMPRQGEDGAAENITEFTAGVAGDPGLAPRMAELYWQTYMKDTVFTGPRESAIPRLERNNALLVVEQTLTLDPTRATRSLVGTFGGKSVAEWANGNARSREVPGSAPSFDRLKNPFLPPISDAHKATLIAEVSKGGMGLKATDEFMSYMLGATDADKVETPAQQKAWAEALANTVGGANCLADGPIAGTRAELEKALATDAGRQLFFGKGVPGPMRNWVLQQMAVQPDNPFRKPWTAADIAKGWESPKVGERLAGEAVAQVRGEFPQPLTFDARAQTGMIANTMGNLMGIPPNSLPGKDETPEQREAREKAGLNHPYFDLKAAPFDKMMGHLAGMTEVRITPIPITYTSNDMGASVMKLMRIDGGKDGPIFLDHNGNRYRSAQHWEEKEELPIGRVSYPKGLELGGTIVSKETNASSTGSRALGILDKVVMGVGIAAGVVAIAATGGLATPLVGAIAVGVGAGAGIYGATRAGQQLAGKSDLGHDIGNIADPEIRALWLDLGSSALSVGALGGAKALGAAAKGAQASRAGANIVAGMTLAGNTVDAVATADMINTLHNTWDRMTPEQQTGAILQVALKLGIGAAGKMQSGQRFQDDFNFTRIRNTLEHGSPFNLRSDDTLAPGEVQVFYRQKKGDIPGDFEIIYGGKTPPPKHMIELHGRAATAMEASTSLKMRFQDWLGGAKKPDRGSAAWEAQFELKKIGDKAAVITKQINAAKSPEEIARLSARLDELNGALIVQSKRVDDWIATGKSGAGEGYVGAPTGGDTQRLAKGWPDPPEGHIWVAGPGGDKGTPFLRRIKSNGELGERMFYDADKGGFVKYSERPDAGMTVVGHGENEILILPKKDGKTAEVHAILRRHYQNAERTPEELAAQRKAGKDGLPGDDGGHIVGHRFGLGQGEQNLFPQEANFNRVAYNRMESEFATWITAGAEVRMSVTLSKFDGKRPARIEVSYAIVDPKSGKVVDSDVLRFENNGNQTYTPKAKFKDKAAAMAAAGME